MKALMNQSGSVRIYFDGKGKDRASVLDIGLTDSGRFFICTDYGSHTFMTRDEFCDLLEKLKELV